MIESEYNEHKFDTNKIDSLQNTANSQVFKPKKPLAERNTCICNVLENCVDQLRIVANLKYANETTDPVFQKTWNLLMKTLIVLREELKNHGTHHILDEILKHERALKKRQNLDIVESLEHEIENLEFQYNNVLSKFEKELSEKDDVILMQSDELQKVIHENERALEFEKTWLQVQIEEDQLRFELKEKELREEIKTLDDDIEDEKLVHSEIMWYYEEEMKEIAESIWKWKGQFHDITEREEEVKQLSLKQEKLHRELNIYRNQFDTRQTLMDEYLADKERRRQEYEYQQFLHAEATKIQSWWRGVMVRKFIGPFRYLLKVRSNRKRKMSLKRIKK